MAAQPVERGLQARDVRVRVALRLDPPRQRRGNGDVQLVGGVVRRLLGAGQPPRELSVAGQRLFGGERVDKPDGQRVAAVLVLEQLVADDLQGEGVPAAQLGELERLGQLPWVPLEQVRLEVELLEPLA